MELFLLTSNRPHIPESIKLEVRKRCHFGCVVCGLPLYHYDHIEDYSITRAHDADNITLLCGYHHDQKTRGYLPTFTVREANRSPKNSRLSTTAPDRWYFSDGTVRIEVGSNIILSTFKFQNYIDVLRVRGEQIIRFDKEQNDLLLSMTIRNHLGREIFCAHKGEITASTENIDIKLAGGRLEIDPGDGIPKTIIEKAANGIIFNHGGFIENGLGVWITPGGIRVILGGRRTVIRGNTSVDLAGGILIDC